MLAVCSVLVQHPEKQECSLTEHNIIIIVKQVQPCNPAGMLRFQLWNPARQSWKEVLSDSLSTEEPISVLLSVTIVGSDCCTLPLKTAEDEEEIRVTVSMADAKEITVDAVTEQNWVTFFLYEKRATLQAFLGGKDVSTLHLTGFGKSLVEQSSASQLTMAWWRMFHVASRTNRKPRPVANWLN